MSRVAVYIDGHNTYKSMDRWQTTNPECIKWIDYWGFCKKMLADSELLVAHPRDLVAVNYYTAFPADNNDRKERHETFVNAMESCAIQAGGAVRTVPGFYRVVLNGEQCSNCGFQWPSRKEKKSDTTLCVELLDDAYQDVYDCAVVLSEDSDMAPAMAMVKLRYPAKTVVAAYPPRTNRKFRNNDLEMASDMSIRTIGLMRSSQMPDPVITGAGDVLHCPESWIP